MIKAARQGEKLGNSSQGRPVISARSAQVARFLIIDSDERKARGITPENCRTPKFCATLFSFK